MKMSDFTIPAALLLALDDIGWFRGRDERAMDQPSRTGMPRNHVLEDYIVVNEIGKRVNMKINMMFCVGEWDRHNILRNAPYSTKEGKDWDTSEFLDLKEAERIRDFVNSAEYLEMGIHALLHHFWDNGTRVSGQEFFPPVGLVPPNGPNDPADFVPAKGLTPNSPREMAPEWLIRNHLDAFMEIYNDWGFTGKLRTFTSPAGPRNAGETDAFANILKDYGVQYWHNGKLPSMVRHGIIMNPKVFSIAPWEAYDINPRKLPVYDPETAGILGGHWVNLLRYDPECNLERVDAWAAWLNRQAEIFGMMLARDAEFAHHQQMYKTHCTVEETDGCVRIDLTRVDDMLPGRPKAPLYISVRKGSEPVSCQGGTLTKYEERNDFITYEIRRTDAGVITLQ